MPLQSRPITAMWANMELGLAGWMASSRPIIDSTLPWCSGSCVLTNYSAGRAIRTQENERQPQVLRQLLSGLTASLRFLSGGRPPGTKASFRFSAGSGEGRAGVATRNRSFETWALSRTKTTFLQREVDFLSPRPTACCADRERYQLRFLHVLTSHRARSWQPQVLSGPDHKAA